MAIFKFANGSLTRGSGPLFCRSRNDPLVVAKRRWNDASRGLSGDSRVARVTAWSRLGEDPWPEIWRFPNG